MIRQLFDQKCHQNISPFRAKIINSICLSRVSQNMFAHLSVTQSSIIFDRLRLLNKAKFRCLFLVLKKKENSDSNTLRSAKQKPSRQTQFCTEHIKWPSSDQINNHYSAFIMFALRTRALKITFCDNHDEGFSYLIYPNIYFRIIFPREY